MNILLVAGGSPDEWPRLNTAEFDYFVGIDRGCLFILEQGWSLDLAVGDFDSLTAVEQNLVKKQAKKVHQAKAEKDDTDTQLALALAVKQFPTAMFTIIGATGGRLDHFLANLWLVLEPRFLPFAGQICLKDQKNTVTYYLPGNYRLKKEEDMVYLAYCCLTPVQNLTLAESKYTLNHADVTRPTSYASNEFVGQTASFSFDSGLVAVIQSKD